MKIKTKLYRRWCKADGFRWRNIIEMCRRCEFRRTPMFHASRLATLSEALPANKIKLCYMDFFISFWTLQKISCILEAVDVIAYRGEKSARHRWSSRSVADVWVRGAAVATGRVITASTSSLLVQRHRSAHVTAAATTAAWRLWERPWKCSTSREMFIIIKVTTLLSCL